MMEAIAEYYGLTLDELKSESRKKELVLARGVAMRVAKRSF